MSSPDLRSEAIGGVDPKDAPNSRREKSRDVMVTLEAWFTKMEIIVADKLEAYDERIEKLESGGDELWEEMQSALNFTVDILQQRDTSLREENAVLRNQVEVLLKELVEFKEKIYQYDVALTTRGMVSHPFMAKDMPKPKPYKGFRNAGRLITSFGVWKSTSMLSDFEMMPVSFRMCPFILKTSLHYGGVGDARI